MGHAHPGCEGRAALQKLKKVRRLRKRREALRYGLSERQKTKAAEFAKRRTTEHQNCKSRSLTAIAQKRRAGFGMTVKEHYAAEETDIELG